MGQFGWVLHVHCTPSLMKSLPTLSRLLAMPMYTENQHLVATSGEWLISKGQLCLCVPSWCLMAKVSFFLQLHQNKNSTYFLSECGVSDHRSNTLNNLTLPCCEPIAPFPGPAQLSMLTQRAHEREEDWYWTWESDTHQRFASVLEIVEQS